MTQDSQNLIPPREIPDRIRDAWIERGWSEDVLVRAYKLRVREADIERWLKRGKSALRRIKRDLDQREQFQEGTLRIREATWNDDDAVADLYANSPEGVADEEVTVDRSPNPFAVFRLQENVSIQVVEDRGVLLASIAHSVRRTLVGGHDVNVFLMQAWRSRREARGHGIGRMLQTHVRNLTWRHVPSSYYYRRRRRKGGVFAKVHCYAARPTTIATDGIRLGTDADLPRCIELINRTHEGLDLFRPYTIDFLSGRLDDPFWGPKPAWWASVYGWPDFYVLEDDGEVVACGGLWDRGANLREIWQRGDGNRIVENTALMDFGCANGRADAMARLIEHLIGKTHDLGRGALMAPLQYASGVAALLTAHEFEFDTRPFYWQPSQELKKLGVKVTKPYTDLAYW